MDPLLPVDGERLMWSKHMGISNVKQIMKGLPELHSAGNNTPDKIKVKR